MAVPASPPAPQRRVVDELELMASTLRHNRHPHVPSTSEIIVLLEKAARELKRTRMVVNGLAAAFQEELARQDAPGTTIVHPDVAQPPPKERRDVRCPRCGSACHFSAIAGYACANVSCRWREQE